MAWKKPSPALSALLDEALAGYEVENKRMFGCPAFYAGQTWFAGVQEDHLVLRLSEPDREAIMSRHQGAALFEPFQGRVMKEFVVLPESVIADRSELDRWLRRGFDHASAMPTPEKKKAEKKTPPR
ncbi:MAG: TfoX/Sxy family protein [Proteobacteria bacterium]|nr:TfoX/Sxy family protein [Pseudomonadota bacterium]